MTQKRKPKKVSGTKLREEVKKLNASIEKRRVKGLKKLGTPISKSSFYWLFKRKDGSLLLASHIFKNEAFTVTDKEDAKKLLEKLQKRDNLLISAAMVEW